MDLEQATDLTKDISEAVSRGSQSIVFMFSNNPEHQASLRRAMTTYNVDDVPEPDVVIADTAFTLGLSISPEQAMRTVKFWAGETPDGDMN